MELSDEQRKKYAAIANDAVLGDVFGEDQATVQTIGDVTERVVAAVAVAARRDLLLQIAQDLHGWDVINPEGRTHWPMVNILLKYDKNYLRAERDQDVKDAST